MAAYKDLIGQKITKVTSNPGEPKTGQMWYNSTDGKLRGLGIVEAWASDSSTVNVSQGRAGFGSQTAAVAGPGAGPGGGIQVTEEYNGSGWSNGNNSTRSADENRYVAGAGTPTAGAIASGGYPGTMTAETEEYDGTSWTAGNNIGTAVRSYVFDGASYTSALVTGGNSQPYPGTSTQVTTTQIYDGTNWTTGGAMSSGRRNHSGSSQGSETASLVTSGNVPGLTANTEEYNGTAWSEVTNQPVAIAYQGYAGTQTNTIVWNGYTPTVVTTTLGYDGSSWSSKPAVALGRLNYHNNSGTASAAMIFGGEGPSGNVSTVEQFNSSTNTITAGAWASGGALNVPRQQTYGAGSQTAGLIFGGEGPPGARNQTEEYDGSTWTAVNNMPATNKDHAGFGIQTAAVACGGSPNTTSINYDGTNWTASPGSLNTGRTNAGGTGTQTAGLTFGGYPSITATEEYGGSTWTTGGALPASRSNIFAAGTQTAALGAGGGPPTSTNTYEYDGSSWTAGNALISGTIDARGGGTQTDALYAGGYLHPGSGNPTTTLGYDGTNWSTRPSLATATAGGGSGQNAAPANANWIAGGFSPAPSVGVTQEFTGETEAILASTLTSS